MRRVAEGLQGVAKGVRVYEWKDAPEGGDAADNPAVLVRTKSGTRALFAEMAVTPQYCRPILRYSLPTPFVMCLGVNQVQL
jgi:hypothetical protein